MSDQRRSTDAASQAGREPRVAPRQLAGQGLPFMAGLLSTLLGIAMIVNAVAAGMWYALIAAAA